MNEQDIDIWEEEDDASPLIEENKVTDKDILNLGKVVLAVCAIIFVIIAVVRIIFPTEETKEVWDFSKVALNSIVSVIIGLYFGKKSQA
jgi:hypothetical protein